MTSSRLTAFCLAAACACSSAALADGHLEKAVDARKGLMQVVAFTLGPLGAMAKGEIEYDAEVATTNAKNMEALAKLDSGAMWPEGSDSEALGEDKTRALPAAWAADSQVMEKHMAWVEASTQLAAVAGDGLDALRPAVAEVGKSCGGCHDDYRAEKK